jgi:hypothetical protein
MKQAAGVLAMLFAAALTTACSNNSQKILGTWQCRTENPDGETSGDTFAFSENARVSINSAGMLMYGSYTVSGSKLTIVIDEIPAMVAYGRSSRAHEQLDGTIAALNENTLEMTTITSHGSRRHSLCSK